MSRPIDDPAIPVATDIQTGDKILLLRSVLTHLPESVLTAWANALITAAIAGKAPLASPALTGTPTAPTAAPGTNTTQLATTEFVAAGLASLVASSPAALDTLNELAAALGNDANFATTVTNALAGKAAASHTHAVADLSDASANARSLLQAANYAAMRTLLALYTTTEVDAALALKAPLDSPALTGTPTAPTAAPGTSTTQLATTAFVAAAAGSGTSIKQTVTQTAHGFTAGANVYRKADSTYALAQADALGTADVAGKVESVTDANTFVMVTAGLITLAGASWTPGGKYFLSEDTAGGDVTDLSGFAQTSFSTALFTALSATTAIVRIGEPQQLALIPNSALAADAARPAQVSSPEIAAGSETALRSYSPADIAAIAGAFGGGIASFTTGMTMLWPDSLSGSIPSGWVASGSVGTPAATSPDADYIVIVKVGAQVATPTFNPVAGTYGSTQSVTLSTATSGASIRYTTNGSTPDRTTGTVYSGAISVSASQTIKAIAYKDYYPDSTVASAAFVIDAVPTLGSEAVAANGTSFTATLSESGCTPASGTGGFTLSGTSATLGAWTISGTTLSATLTGTVLSSETVTLSYARASTTDDIADSTGNFLADFSGHDVTNNSTQTSGGSYGFVETFEGSQTDSQGTAGYDNTGWTSSASSNNPNYATSPAPLEGTQSFMGGTGTFTSITHAFPTASDEQWVKAMFILPNTKWWTNSTYLMRLRNAADASVMDVTPDAGGLTIVCGASASYLSLSVGTLYYLWIRYVKGTGSNAVVEMYLSTTDTRPGSPNASITTGTSTTAATKASFYGGDAGFIWDHIILNASAIGSN